MTQTIEIHLPEQTAEKLRDAARRLGVSVEEFLRTSIEEKLARIDVDFKTAADYVLEKNAELYRRLA